MNEKITLLAETLDTDEEILTPAKELEQLEEWDSMGIISVIAMLDKKYGVQLKADQIQALKSVGDILNIMEKQ
ncbi:MAG TPA: acyl carrier protein [Synergistaceae bacterium]|nr:acyl carrier protein [Synergistaceae bacterium]